MKVQAHYTPAFKALVVKDAEKFSSNQKQVLAKVEQNPEIISMYESINYDIVAEPSDNDEVSFAAWHKNPGKRDIHSYTFLSYGKDEDPVDLIYHMKDGFYRLKEHDLDKKLIYASKAILLLAAIGIVAGLSSLGVKIGKSLATKVETVQTVDTLKNVAKDTLQFSKFIK